MTRPLIAALILTYNEEKILPKCLEALDFADHILVFDSNSMDNTLAIARSFGANIHQRRFDDYATQRNHALAAIPSNYDWVLMVDADEIVTPELRTEILEKIQWAENTTMFRVRRKDMFMDTWIRQSSGYPTWFPRLFRNGTVKVRRAINEEYETTGSIGQLKGHLIHYPFNKGMHWWFEKHNRYSEMEAHQMLLELQEQVHWLDLISKDPVVRRKAQKQLSYHLPYRPLWIFCALYFLRGGFLNGKAGYTFCRMRKTYEWMIEIKYRELKKSRSIESINGSSTKLYSNQVQENLPPLQKVNLASYNNEWYRPASWVKRAVWYTVSSIFFKGAFPYPYSLKRWILKCFGAKIGKGLVIKPHVSIKYPWLLYIGKDVWIGEGSCIENLAPVTIGNSVCISQGSMLLCGNHNYKTGSFDLLIAPIILEDGSWIGAKSVVCPGVTVRSHAILGVGSVATNDLAAYIIYQGNPASQIRKRSMMEKPIIEKLSSPNSLSL